MKKPIIYIASPYTKGDPAINVRFQCRIFDKLLTEGKVWPIAPLWTHFQHIIFPRPYEDWLEYDNALLPLYDGCLRLNSEEPALDYIEEKSSGADGEVEAFKAMDKPIFYSIESLYEWVESLL
ncbi:MAG: hypothetical protein CEE38_05950 [Planctomycetes bacterium B3_Pla]|nr:MAG: hypothetical protein CEE38_05950 [Planctomycetes bacterium B3_Pla]